MGEDDEQPEAAEASLEAAETDDDEGESSSTESATVSIHDRALKGGWRPRNQWKGDPKSWMPAEDFLRHRDPKYLREQLSETKKALKDLAQAREQDAKSFADRLDRFEAMSKAQRGKLYSDIEAARRQAVVAGDTDEYDRLNRVEADLVEQEQAAGKPSAKPKEQASTDNDEIIEAWIDDNPWWDTDAAMQHAAMTINTRIAKRYPNLSVQEQLDKTKEEVVKRFPEKFGEKKPAPKGNGHSAVEGGQRMAAQPKGKGFTDIPAEERKIIERHIEEGLYKDKADAAKAYWRS